MPTKKSDNSVETIVIPEVSRGHVRAHILGTTPLILNRMSEKARHELLFPEGRKNAAARAQTFKHDPLAEYRASPYIIPSDEAPTLLALMSSSFKGAIRTAALDLPGASKAQLGRLVYVEGDYTGVYGTPKLSMSVVRMADISKTPDIRTRAILPRWACTIEVQFVTPLLNAKAIYNALSAAGVTVGVGDWRAEKGNGNYGSFIVVNPDDPEYVEVLKEGRATQKAAIETPDFYDAESEEMFHFWTQRAKERRPSSGTIELERDTADDNAAE